MKILLLVYILFGLVQQNICSAQNSFPTLADNPKWRVLERVVSWPPGIRYFMDYTLEKDTLINDLNYSIVIRSDTSYTILKSYRIGYTRTSGKKVYFKFIDGMEYMIYDFSLNVGESCYCYMCGIGLDKYTALKVDTITIDGIKRKRIQVDAESLSGFPSYWIEGIGSNLNPFLNYCSGVQDELRCLTTNGGTIYMNPKYTDCETLYQITHTIVNANTQWAGLNVKFTNTAADSLFSYSIRFEGDTICNYIPYTKIWQSSDSLSEHWKLYGLIREEYKKTWYLPLDEVEEHLLYDFSVTPEQTISVTNSSGFAIQMKVTGVDSVEVYGVNRLRIQLKGMYNDSITDTWIEKIGSMHGILSSCYDIPGWKNNLLCVKENGNTIYTNQTYPNCFYSQNSLTKNEQLLFQNNIEIYPNPASDNLFIDNKNDRRVKLQIRFCNLNGGIIYNKVVSGYHNAIDISMIPSGLYLIQIITDSSILNKKVIKR
jgi:hypothetical protein